METVVAEVFYCTSSWSGWNWHESRRTSRQQFNHDSQFPRHKTAF